MIVRWTPAGLWCWTLGDGWGENGPFETFREAVDDYDESQQAQAAVPHRADFPQVRGALTNPQRSKAPTDPLPAPFLLGPRPALRIV